MQPISDMTAAHTSQNQISLRGISKSFDRVQALDAVDFDVRAGEVHALLGENGAGKSTLMKILYGLYQPDAGEITMDGRSAQINSPRTAAALGLALVQQHFSLIDCLTVAENVLLGLLPSRFYRPQTTTRTVQGFIDAHGFSIDARAKIEELAVGARQRVEIIKALYRHAQFLIFDEPTSVLSPPEINSFFAIVRQLVRSGKGIVLITHKLREIFEVSDRVTVLRAGKRVATMPIAYATMESLAALMVGNRETSSAATPADSASADSAMRTPILQVENLVVGGDAGHRAVDQVSFELRAGEILGVAGVDGNGQSELAEAIRGLRPIAAGAMNWSPPSTTDSSVHSRVGFIPQDRARAGLIASFSLAENAILHDVDNPAYNRHGWLRPQRVQAFAERLIADFRIRCDGPAQPVKELSGGNQQKLVVGRALLPKPAILIALNPTWGVDVATAAMIHRELQQLRAGGGAVLLFSTELDEIYALADRFFVLHAGRINGWATPATPISTVGMWMTGADFSTPPR